MVMKILKVDEKWSVEYDPDNNDRPTRWLRYGEELGTGKWDENNPTTAMFYAMLKASQPETQDAEPVAWQMLKLAAETFCNRVDAGEIRSKRSYSQFKDALNAIAHPAPQPSDEAATLRAQLAEAKKNLLIWRDRAVAEEARAEAAEAALAAAEDHADVLAEKAGRLIHNLTEGEFVSTTREAEWAEALAAHMVRRTRK